MTSQIFSGARQNADIGGVSAPEHNASWVDDPS